MDTMLTGEDSIMTCRCLELTWLVEACQKRIVSMPNGLALLAAIDPSIQMIDPEAQLARLKRPHPDISEKLNLLISMTLADLGRIVKKKGPANSSSFDAGAFTGLDGLFGPKKSVASYYSSN
jgi:hypothetical protein